MLFVDMGTDDKGVIAFGETLGKLHAQAIGLVRCDPAGDEGLPDLIGDHIIFATAPAGLGEVLPLGKKKLRVSNFPAALITGDELAVVCFLWIFYIVQNVPDSRPHRPALANMEGDDTGGSYGKCLLLSLRAAHIFVDRSLILCCFYLDISSHSRLYFSPPL